MAIPLIFEWQQGQIGPIKLWSMLLMAMDAPESKVMAKSLEDMPVMCISLSARSAQRQLWMEDALLGY